MTFPKSLALLTAAIIACPSDVFAWGSEGHRIITEIADQYLTPDTRKDVRDLLATENSTTLPDVAN